MILAVVVTGLLMAGCEEEQASADVKMHRLIAEENRQLKKQMDTLKSQMQQQKEQLSQCEQERQKYKENFDETLEERIDQLMTISSQATSELMAEIERLKAELAKLKEPGPAEVMQEQKQEKEKPDLVQ